MSRLSRGFKTPTVWLLIAISIPLIIALGQVWEDSRRWPFFLYGDQALIDIAVHRSLEFLQLTGPYSRFGWDHPGPLYYFLLSPGVLVIPSGLGIYFGAVLINWLFAALATLLIAKTARPRTAVIMVAVLLLFMFAQGPFALRDPWNPAIVVIPLVAALFAVVVKPSVWSISLVAFGCSVALESHFGTVSVVTAIVVTMLAVHVKGQFWKSAAWLRGTEERHWIPRWRSVAIVAGVTVFCWLLPIIQQLAHGRDGNFGSVIKFNLTNDGERHTLAEAAQAVIGASWLPSSPTILPPHVFPGSIWIWFVGWLVVAFVGACLAWRCQTRVAFALNTFALLGLVIVTVAVSRIVGHIEVYLLWWIPLPFLGLLAGWLVLIFGEDGLFNNRGRTAASFIVVLGLLTATVANIGLTLAGNPLHRESHPEVGVLTAAIENNVQQKRGVIALDLPDEETRPVVAGVVAALFADGYAVDVVPALSESFETSGSDGTPIATFRIAKAQSGNDTGGTIVDSIPNVAAYGNLPISLRRL